MTFPSTDWNIGEANPAHSDGIPSKTWSGTGVWSAWRYGLAAHAVRCCICLWIYKYKFWVDEHPAIPAILIFIRGRGLLKACLRSQKGSAHWSLSVRPRLQLSRACICISSIRHNEANPRIHHPQMVGWLDVLFLGLPSPLRQSFDKSGLHLADNNCNNSFTLQHLAAMSHRSGCRSWKRPDGIKALTSWVAFWKSLDRKPRFLHAFTTNDSTLGVPADFLHQLRQQSSCWSKVLKTAAGLGPVGAIIQPATLFQLPQLLAYLGARTAYSGHI